MRRLLVFLIRGYQYFISPLMAPHCRYYPSCSCYALQAVERHGALRGSFLALKRLLRCNPWSAGGFDPVPEVQSRTSTHCHCGTSDHSQSDLRRQSDLTPQPDLTK